MDFYEKLSCNYVCIQKWQTVIRRSYELHLTSIFMQSLVLAVPCSN